MICACVDIGSNTTRLLVGRCADGGFREVAAERVFTRLGHGLAGGGAISQAKVEEVCATVAAQVAHARALDADRVRVVATAAVRHAANGAELCAAVREAAGLAVELLSPADEARLAFRGATGGLVGEGADLGAPIGVADIGGGSSELVLGTIRDGAQWSVSCDLGSGSLAEACFASDPPAPEEIERARELVGRMFADVTVARPARALAVGGSATSLWRVLGPVLDRAALGAAILALSSMPAREAATRFGLDERRARLLPAGILLLEAAVDRFGRALEISGGGLREGVLLEEAARI